MQNTLRRIDYSVFERELRARRETLRREIHATLTRSREEGHVRLAAEVHDRKDESLADLLAGVDVADVARDAAEIRDIDGALERIRAGTYGSCVGCGAPILLERLQAYLTAKRCISCQRQYERTRAASAIPKL